MAWQWGDEAKKEKGNSEPEISVTEEDFENFIDEKIRTLGFFESIPYREERQQKQILKDHNLKLEYRKKGDKIYYVSHLESK